MKLEEAKSVADLKLIDRKMAHDSVFKNHTVGVWELEDDKKSLKELLKIIIVPECNWTGFTAVRESVASYIYYNFNLQEVKLSHLAPIDESDVQPANTLDQVVEVKRVDVNRVEVKRKDKGVNNDTK